MKSCNHFLMFSLLMNSGIYGAMALAGKFICSISGIDCTGGFSPSLDAIVEGLGYAVPPIMALLFILDVCSTFPIFLSVTVTLPYKLILSVWVSLKVPFSRFISATLSLLLVYPILDPCVILSTRTTTRCLILGMQEVLNVSHWLRESSVVSLHSFGWSSFNKLIFYVKLKIHFLYRVSNNIFSIFTLA